MVLLIGYGNVLRRDDGAGVALVRAVAGGAGDGVRVIEVPQLFPELAEELAAPGLTGAIFCDARPGTAPDGEPVRLGRVSPAVGGSSLGHHGSPEEILAIAGALYGAAPPAWIVTVAGYDFGHGEGFSAAVRDALATAEEMVRALIATECRPGRPIPPAPPASAPPA
ncbi:hydrogenase maturation protease [Geobacter pickeringii]|uniref:hydrogenase maturation protease n=1 Tax=Geobacter pickeringii TaxID=345632 RepID=UPI0009FB9E6E|nr:hydrogenase maturation protease [Geobacter pickeringii]